MKNNDFYDFRALYNGIVPGMQRQMAFSAIRLGAYERVKQFYQELTGCKSDDPFSCFDRFLCTKHLITVSSGAGLLLVRIASGTTTGTLAILSAQPTDVVKIRMQAEVRPRGEPSR